MRPAFLIALWLVLCSAAHAVEFDRLRGCVVLSATSPRIYLGRITDPTTDTASIAHPTSRYGSTTGDRSLRNPATPWGGESQYSAWTTTATLAPRVYRTSNAGEPILAVVTMQPGGGNVRPDELIEYAAGRFYPWVRPADIARSIVGQPYDGNFDQNRDGKIDVADCVRAAAFAQAKGITDLLADWRWNVIWTPDDDGERPSVDRR